MSDPVEEQLYNAAEDGRASEVSSLLKDHPDINVNSTNYERRTALHTASINGHVEVVKLLLAHPNVNVNLKTDDGQTLLSKGIDIGKVSIVAVLLKDPRVKVTLDDSRGCTPLWRASREGKHEMIGCLIASGRDLGDVKSMKAKTGMMAKTFQLLKLQERTARLKLCLCLKDSWPTNTDQSGNQEEPQLHRSCSVPFSCSCSFSFFGSV